MIESKTVRRNRFFLIIYSIFIVLCTILLIRCFTTHPVIVSGDSMMPTYHDGEILTTREVDENGPGIGDVIIFTHHGKISNTKLIKRVVALPGDMVQIKDGILYRNGEAVHEDFPLMEDGGYFDTPKVVPENSCFVLGDNRNNSADSRMLGFVAYEDIMKIVDSPFFPVLFK